MPVYICCNTVAYLVHLLIGVASVMIDHGDIIRVQFRLFAKQRDDSLCVVISHFGSIE